MTRWLLARLRGKLVGKLGALIAAGGVWLSTRVEGWWSLGVAAVIVLGLALVLAWMEAKRPS